MKSKIEEISNLLKKYDKRLRFKIYKLNNRIDYDDVNDLLQDLFIKLARLENFDTSIEGKAIAYIEQALFSLYIDQYRKNSRFTKTELYENSKTEEFEFDDSVNFDLKKMIRPKFYKTFMLYIQGFKYEEISKELNISLSVVKINIHLAKKQLKPYRDFYLKKI